MHTTRIACLALALVFPCALSACDRPAPSQGATPEGSVAPGFEDDADFVMTPAQAELADRLDALNDLMVAELYEDATTEVEWLWHNLALIDEDAASIRSSLLLVFMVDLVELYPPSVPRFEALRDEVEEYVSLDIDDSDTIDEWLALNDLLGDTERVMAWFDRVKDEDAVQDDLRRLAYRIEPFLVSEGRWADLGTIYPMALDTNLRSLARLVQHADEYGVDPLDRQANEEDFQARAAMKCTALLAAGRDADAQKLADYALGVLDDDLMRLAIVSFGVDAGVTHPLQLRWLQGVKDRREHADALARQIREATEG